MSERALARSVRNNIHLDLNFSTKFTIILTTSIGLKALDSVQALLHVLTFRKSFKIRLNILKMFSAFLRLSRTGSNPPPHR